MIGKVINEMLRYFDNDVRRINHALKVYGFARGIGASEALNEEENQVLDMAAVLHDIGIKEAERKYGSTAGPYQEKEGPPIARAILKGLDVPEALIERVCHLVGNHHSYGKIDGLDFQILVEADFIVNIHEDNMSREACTLVGQKYFKTARGKNLLESMYLNANEREDV